MYRMGDLGYNVCVWPNYIKEKDINAMILSGLQSDKIYDIIKQNTFNDLQLKVQIANWKLL